MAKDMENAEILEQATRALAAGVLKDVEPAPVKNAISLDDLFKDSAEEIKLDFWGGVGRLGACFLG
eukprot:4039950-Pyramimonas_sp.AAC.1